MSDLSGEALKLERGGIYVLHYKGPLTKDETDIIKTQLAEAGDKLAIEFILLPDSITVAAEQDGERYDNEDGKQEYDTL